MSIPHSLFQIFWCCQRQKFICDTA